MKILIISSLIIFTYGCNAQLTNDTDIKKKNKMEKFDKLTFEKNKVNGEYIYTLEDGSEVRQMENLKSLEYTEEIREPGTPFSRVKVFFMENGQLKVVGDRFYLIPIGKWQYYDKFNNLEKETDWDVEYKFTIYDLANMMLEKDVNIMKIQKGIDVLRSDIAGPRYIIVYPVDSIKRPYDFYNLVINGISGEEIEKTIISVRR